MLIGLWLPWAFSAGAETSDPRVSFRAQGLPEPRSVDPSSLATRELVRVFQERHSDIAIEAFGMPQVHGEAMDSGPLMAIAAGVPPHAIYVNFRQSSTYIEQGFLEPLEPLLARVLSDDDRLRQTDAEGNWLADPSEQAVAHSTRLLQERVPQSVWPVAYREGLAPGQTDTKHVWAMPLSLSVGVLMYRKDLFAEAGIDPDRPPTTWDELLDYARRLTVPSRNQYGLMIYGGQYLSWGSYTLLVSNGGRAMDRGEDGVWSASFDTPEMAEAAAFLWQLAREPFVAPHDDGRMSPGAAIVGPGTGAELDRMWQRGQIGMTFQSFREDLVTVANPQLIGVAPVPTAPRGNRGAEVNAQMLGVFSGSTNAQKLAVMRFIWFLGSEEAQRIRTRIYVENGFGRFANPLWLERYGYEDALAQVPPSIRDLYATVFEDGVPEPYGQNTQHIYRYMSEPLLAALESDLREQTPAERAEQILPMLEAAAQKTNAKLLGKLTDEEITQRRWVGWGALALLVAALGLTIVSTWRYFTRFAPPGSGNANQRWWLPWLMLAPALGIMAFWIYVPLGWAFGLSFYRLPAGHPEQLRRPDELCRGVCTTRSSGRRSGEPSTTSPCCWDWVSGRLSRWRSCSTRSRPAPPSWFSARSSTYPPLSAAWSSCSSGSSSTEINEFGVLNQLLLSLNSLGPIAATGVKLIVYAFWGGLLVVVVRVAARSGEFGLGRADGHVGPDAGALRRHHLLAARPRGPPGLGRGARRVRLRTAALGLFAGDGRCSAPSCPSSGRPRGPVACSTWPR